MINNRLFKKINSIFWGIISWMPVFLFLLLVISYSLTLDINAYDSGFDFLTYCKNCFYYLTDISILSNFFTITDFGESLADFVSLFIDLSSDVPAFVFFLIVQFNWYFIVQLVRLLVYVFMWFINLIYDLFDYLSLNRKGDN